MRQLEPPVRRAKNEHYSISFRQEALRLLQAGHSRRAVTAQLRLGKTTLGKWVRYAQQAPTLPMRPPLFTPTQKHQLVRQLRAGQLTEDEALLQCGLRLKRTLQRWVAEQVAAEAAAVPTAPVATLPAAADAATLTAQLQQARWQIEALHTLIDHAEATYRIEIRKKAGAKPSK